MSFLYCTATLTLISILLDRILVSRHLETHKDLDAGRDAVDTDCSLPQTQRSVAGHPPPLSALTDKSDEWTATATASGSAGIAHPATSLGAREPDNYFLLGKRVGRREPETFDRRLPRQYDSTHAASRADAVADSDSADNGTDAGFSAGQPASEEAALSALAALMGAGPSEAYSDSGAGPSEAYSDPQKQPRQFK